MSLPRGVLNKVARAYIWDYIIIIYAIPPILIFKKPYTT